MYKPNFCVECGAQINRRKWPLWTSRRFCDGCAGNFRKAELGLPLILGAALVIGGFVLGRFLRPPPPPLVVQRLATSPLSDSPLHLASLLRPQSNGAEGAAGRSTGGAVPEEIIYTCGARTKKGTPCARRVHGAVRCWQHKGAPAILPQEKLVCNANC